MTNKNLLRHQINVTLNIKKKFVVVFQPWLLLKCNFIYYATVFFSAKYPFGWVKFAAALNQAEEWKDI